MGVVLLAWFVGASVDSALAQEERDTEHARAAQNVPCNKVIPLVPNQFPSWSDGGGWDDPSQYTTIQLADVDGDGKAELMGRAPGGMTTSRFDTDTGAWLTLATAGPFTDGQGWNASPSLYSTIQFADIDGQPGAEMIGRGGRELFTFKWNGATNEWTSLSTQEGLMSDADGWGSASGYSTIQLADIDGQAGAELIGRRPGPAPTGGMYAYKWNGSSWRQIGFDADLMPDSQGWGQPEYYSTIQLANIDSQPGAELIARGEYGIHTHKWGGTGTGWVEQRLAEIWPDAHGGNTPDIYRTIQTADVDGDGRAELLGRYPDDSGLYPPGVFVFDWDVEWESESELQGFIGNEGWTDPEYFRTIQTADIDGDRQAELLYRDKWGLVTSHYDKTSKTWSQPQETVPRITALSDANGFSLSQSYLTIQAADVAGGKRAEVLARSPTGIETFRSNTPAPAIEPDFESTLQPGFTDYSDDPKLLAAYRWIGQNAVLGVSTNDIRSQYANLAYADRWVDGAEELRNRLNAGKTPDGLDPPAFKTVATQLETEFSYVDFLNTWSTQLNGLFGDIFVDQLFDVIRVPEKMNLPVEGNNTQTVLEVSELIAQLVSAIASSGGPEGEAVAFVANLVGISMEAATMASGEAPNLDTTVAQLQDELQTQSTHSRDAAACIQTAFAQSWGLLKALGEPIAGGQVTWDPKQTPAMAAAAQRGYELVLWQTLTPAKWTAVTKVPPSDPDPEGGCYPDFPDPYPQDSSGNEYWYKLPNWPPGYAALFIQGNCITAPPVEALAELFDPPNPDGTGPLGVSRADAHCGRNGWRIPDSGHACPPPPGTGPTGSGGGATATTRAAARRKGTRMAVRQIRALRAAVSARVGNPQARRTLLRTLRQASSLVTRARRTGIPTYAQMTESTLRAFVGQVQANAGRGLPANLARRHIALAHAIRGLLPRPRGGRPPHARLGGAKVAVSDSGSGAIRVRCGRWAVGPCRGMMRIIRGKRVLARARFSLQPGQARRVGFALKRPTAVVLSRRGALTVKAEATTRHLSGRRAQSSRHVQLRT